MYLIIEIENVWYVGTTGLCSGRRTDEMNVDILYRQDTRSEPKHNPDGDGGLECEDRK